MMMIEPKVLAGCIPAVILFPGGGWCATRFGLPRGKGGPTLGGKGAGMGLAKLRFQKTLDEETLNKGTLQTRNSLMTELKIMEF